MKLCSLNSSSDSNSLCVGRRNTSIRDLMYILCIYFLAFGCLICGCDARNPEEDNHHRLHVGPAGYVRTDDTPMNEVLEDMEETLQLQPWQIQLTILIVISVFIPVVCGTLYAVHAIFDHADDDIRPVAQQLTEELTGIAYLTVIVFCTQTFIHNLSMQIFGDTPAGKSFLGDLLDNTSNMMTLIAGVNIIQVYLLIRLGNTVQQRWKQYNAYCIDHEEGVIPEFYGIGSHKEMTYIERAKEYKHNEKRLTLFQSIADYFCDPLNAYNKHKEYIQKTELVHFYSLRTEVILARSPQPPYLPVKKNRLPSNFDFAQYSSWCLGEILAETISVNRYVWYLVVVVAIIFCIIVMIVGSFKSPVVYITFVIFAYLEVYAMFMIYQKSSSILKFLVNPKHLKYAAKFKDQFRLHKTRKFSYAQEAPMFQNSSPNLGREDSNLIPQEMEDELRREMSIGASGRTLSGKDYRMTPPRSHIQPDGFDPFVEEPESDDEGCGQSAPDSTNAPFDPFAEEPVSDDEGCGQSAPDSTNAPFDPFAEEPVSDDEGCGESVPVPRKGISFESPSEEYSPRKGVSFESPSEEYSTDGPLNSTDTEDAARLWDELHPMLDGQSPRAGRRGSATSHKYTMSSKFRYVDSLRNNSDTAALNSDYDMPGWTLGIKRTEDNNSAVEDRESDCCSACWDPNGGEEGKRVNNRHHELFWFGSLGPDFNMWTLKSHMFLQAIYVTVLLYFFVPHVATYGIGWAILYLSIAIIPVIWMWVGFYEDLICIITFTASSGLLVNKVLINKVLNIQKVKRSHKMIKLLAVMARSLGSDRSNLYDMSDPVIIEEIKYIGAMFDSFDVKENGEIPVYEVDQLLDNMGIALGEHEHVDMLANIDLDGDGSVSRDEFIKWKLRFDRTDMYTHMKLISKELFELIDADHSGSVTAEEFGEGIREHVERTGEKGLKKKEVVEMIRDFDTDGDGEMDLNEFEKLIDFAYGYR